MPVAALELLPPERRYGAGGRLLGVGLHAQPAGSHLLHVNTCLLAAREKEMLGAGKNTRGGRGGVLRKLRRKEAEKEKAGDCTEG